MPLTDIIALSNFYGSDPDYVLAGGGNTSVKENGVLYVKASGTRLGDITAEGFVVETGRFLRMSIIIDAQTDDILLRI